MDGELGFRVGVHVGSGGGGEIGLGTAEARIRGVVSVQLMLTALKNRKLCSKDRERHRERQRQEGRDKRQAVACKPNASTADAMLPMHRWT